MGLTLLLVAGLCACRSTTPVAPPPGTDPARADGVPPLAEPASAADPRAVYDRVFDTVAASFFDPDLRGLDWEALRAAHGAAADEAPDEDALRAVLAPPLEALRTSHTRFLTSSDPAFHDLVAIFDRPGDFPAVYPDGQALVERVGLFTERRREGWFVSGVLHGSPAAVAGLVVGDLVLAADDAPFDPVASFTGRAGAPLVLTVQRDGGGRDVRRLTAVPERVQPVDALLAASRASMVVERRRDRAVAYARIWSYADPRVQEALEQAVIEGALADAEALVLDLRGGWGGADPSVLDLFHRRVPALSLTDREGRTTVFGRRWTRPVVLLVDEGTRSGKEALAWAFRKHAIGPVVGGRTAGAFTGGSVFPVGPRSLLYLAVAEAAVDGERLEGRGVRPDVEVPFDLPFSGGRDPRRERALDLAAQLVEAAEDG